MRLRFSRMYKTDKILFLAKGLIEDERKNQNKNGVLRRWKRMQPEIARNEEVTKLPYGGGDR